jgi:hypothetical protein
VCRLILFSSALAVGLGLSAAARAQDATPPPPPPDAEPAQAQSTVRAVRLSDVEGQVQIFQGDQIAFDQAEPNMPAVEGMRFVTGDNGRVEIEFEDGSVARVTPDSSIRLTQLRRDADGSTVTQIDALSGLSYYELNSGGGQYNVRFAADTASPNDSAVFRVDLDSVPFQLAVMHGSVHVEDGQSGGLSLDVRPSQTFQTDPQQPGEFTVAQNLSANSWDQWNSDRDQALSQLESSETTARVGSGNPNDPAWNDLDYYGNWYNLPGYGQVWSPAGVGAGWDPFGNGSWGYYPSFGYTWISGYPWGWWPYHCGAWDFLSGWGWVWAPGNCGWGVYGTGWYPYATVWRVPQGYLPPRRPTVPVPGRNPRSANLITVNRGPQYAAPFHFEHGTRPAPRPLSFGGTTIAPEENGIHPLERGPLGEPFTATLTRTHPEIAPSSLRTPSLSGFRSPSPGTRILGAPPRFPVPHSETARPSAPRSGSSAPAGAGQPSSGGGGHAAPSGGAHH